MYRPSLRSRWLDIGQILFACLWTKTPSRSNRTKKNEVYPVNYTDKPLTLDVLRWNSPLRQRQQFIIIELGERGVIFQHLCQWLLVNKGIINRR